MKKRRAQPGDVYAVPLEDGTFTACQVVRRLGHGGLQVTEFDWIGAAPPPLEELEAAAPLRLRSAGSEPLVVEISDSLPPRRFLWLGSTEPLGPVSQRRPNWLSDWESAIGRSVGRLHREPDPALAAAVGRAVDTSRARWNQLVVVDLDGKPQEVPLGCTELNVYEGAVREFAEPDPGIRLVVRPGVRLEWSQLDQLDGLYTIRYRGADRGFGDYLKRRWLLWEAVWLDHDEPRIDLGATSVRRFRVAIPRRGLHLELPDTIEHLSLDVAPGAGALDVSHFLRGAALRLTLRGRALSAVSGLDRVRRLDMLLEGPTLDLGALPALPDLEEIRAWGSGGSLASLQSLAAFPRLRIVRFDDFFDFDPESLPPPATWPELDTVEFHGLTKENAVVLRGRFRGIYRLRISGSRPAKWIEATRANPFGHWLDRDAAVARRATRAYATAARAIARLGPSPAPEDLDPILKRFVNTFNDVNRSGFIETVERDEVWGAFKKLAEPPLAAAETEERFNRWRDF